MCAYWAEWEATGGARGPPAGQKGQRHPQLALKKTLNWTKRGAQKAVPHSLLPPQGWWWPPQHPVPPKGARLGAGSRWHPATSQEGDIPVLSPKMSPVGTPNPTGINYPAPQCPELGCAQDLAQPSPIFGCPPPHQTELSRCWDSSRAQIHGTSR